MSDRPNILFILMDQMRGDCLSVLGHTGVDTPNMDQIAHQGVLFESAYSSCPSCVAARASIFTGLSPSNHGRLGYADRVAWNYDHMAPQVLGDAGYQTHCVGKTHFFPQRAHCGFHSLDSYEAGQNFDGLYVNDYREWLRDKTNGMMADFDHGVDSNSWNARPSHLPEELHNNTWVVTKGIEFMKRRDKSRPFFLNLSFHRPHAPIDPPAVFWDMYRDRDVPPVPVGDWAHIHDVPIDDVNAWRGRLPDHLLWQAQRGYYAQIAHIDSQIGRVVRALHDLEAGPTAIIVTSDHGEMLGDHNLFRKTYAYEGSAKVPLIVSFPGTEKGLRCDAPVVLEDLYPTLLELGQAELPDDIDGQSLLPFCTDADNASRREYVHGEHTECYDRDESMQFITDGKEKYIWYPPTGREQLFDLANDPDECHDLAHASGQKKRLERWRSRMVDVLSRRPQDGLTDGKKLLPGTVLPSVREEIRQGAKRAG